MTGAPAIPGLADIEEAAARLDGHIVRTPLLEAAPLDAIAGGRLLIKAECLQRTGAFKLRGAWNRLCQLDAAARKRGVVAYSSGNHGRAVAAAAAAMGMRATIVMPGDAPQVKLDGTRAYGAEIVVYDPKSELREDVAARIVSEGGGTLVPPFDDPMIIAGQGTVGLEIVDQARDIDIRPDAVLVPCSGGGLVGGCAIALKTALPEIEVVAVEPRGFDDTARSLAAGTRQPIEPGHHTFCDALRVPIPGELTFEINRRHLAGGVAVSDTETAAAMSAAFRHLRLVVEPGGAVALAAALTGRYDCRDKTVVVVCSGGNVDPETYARAITRY